MAKVKVPMTDEELLERMNNALNSKVRISPTPEFWARVYKRREEELKRRLNE